MSPSRPPVSPHPPELTSSELAHAAFLAVQRLAGEQGYQSLELLKAHGLSPAQYNVLRILRGAAPEGLTCGEIGARLINRDSDVTRLLDRLEKQRYVERGRTAQDRRVVTSRITPDALDVLARLDAPVIQLHVQQFGALDRPELETLLRLLDTVFVSPASPRND